MRGATGDDVSNSSSDDAESRLEDSAGTFSSPRVVVATSVECRVRDGRERRIEEEEEGAA